MSAFQPLDDRIVVEVLTVKEQKTDSGLFIPDNAREPSQTGKVLAVGPGRLLDNGSRAPCQVRPGHIVYFAKYGGSEVKVDAESFTVLNERDILGVLL